MFQHQKAFALTFGTPKSGGSFGLFVDIGAVKPFVGSVFVKSQVDGRGSQQCSEYVHLVGALHDGTFMGYSSPVLDED